MAGVAVVAIHMSYVRVHAAASHTNSRFSATTAGSLAGPHLLMESE
eukprot:CAMPEP_0177683570 /NCGR_PEP_ID=MMETSP0447-20121125/31877_1 /TAXON_ID=0 /ORGANISM="Stygamoeba regulata, Strain BSH-02190019" /LENGTH=45 /DNA_ID= /DNA_START= /DNA_END= /DNA_ORIENTATION=